MKSKKLIIVVLIMTLLSVFLFTACQGKKIHWPWEKESEPQPQQSQEDSEVDF